MDVQERERPRRPISEISAPVLAVAALAIEVAVIVIPWNGSFAVNQLGFIFGDGFALADRIANVFSIFAFTLALGVGIVVLSRGSAVLAAGVFLGCAVLLAAWDASMVVGLISGRSDTWQSIVATFLRVTECALLLLAAGAARRETSALS